MEPKNENQILSQSYSSIKRRKVEKNTDDPITIADLIKKMVSNLILLIFLLLDLNFFLKGKIFFFDFSQ